MKALIFAILATAVLAFPVAESEVNNEPIPDLRLPCVCPAPSCPPFLSAKSRCQCKNAAAQACFLKANGGCTEPKTQEC
ncbi:hypothetical protein NU195Hw_g584t1 [Hortaea werneckii]